MSRNKCRICGYRFKSDDEIICPECFTARDEDISCNSFSDDLHSHDLRADNEQDGWFGQSENDTFKEEKNDFVSFGQAQDLDVSGCLFGEINICADNKRKVAKKTGHVKVKTID